ncbi:RNA-binding protein 34 isoform X2 [Girardinichthys multiradiatus]|uniref:RNA-binding protein 34 isoform X2 n=1 Tax=Girardinichthys multiradiatus TaxID=208333 RepID=UPI001FACD867|nr:RNA-binding protein 34 isoform X2 [Girardinichthys multiradiatus]
MKKRVHYRETSLLSQRSSVYAVGQVSGSLFHHSSEASESLSELFGTALPASFPLCQPVSKLNEKSTERDEQQKGSLEVNVEVKQKTRHPRKTSVAEQELLNRESSLLRGDSDEHGQEKSMKKRRRASETGRENSAENWTLRRLFRDKGPIESVRFRSVVREDPSMSRKEATIKRKVHPKKQSINAYLVFKNEAGVAKALERNGMEIEKGFHIRVDRVANYSSHDHKRSVFVGNLAFDIKEFAFRRHFEECGKVEAVRLVRDPKSGLGKGFGYILFENVDSVQMALALNGSKLESRSIRVKRSLQKEKQKNKTNGKGTLRHFSQNAAHNSGGVEEPGQTTLKSKPNNLYSFNGEMVDPNKKKKKALKKKKKTKKIHIQCLND